VRNNKTVNGICFLVACFALAIQAQASSIQIDIAGTITNTYILNGDTGQKDASLWSLSDALTIDSTLNFTYSYNTDTPSSYSQVDGSNSANFYQGSGISISTPAFQVTSMDSGINIIDNLFMGWDTVDTGFQAPYGTGVALSFQDELYYLVGASIAMTDISGTALEGSSLPANQSSLDAFWLNSTEPNAFSNYIGGFYLQFIKDPSLNAVFNNTWPAGDTLYVVGFFEGASLSNVPEPNSLVLTFLGMLAVFAMRYVRMKNI
jgi:hypothetical protein